MGERGWEGRLGRPWCPGGERGQQPENRVEGAKTAEKTGEKEEKRGEAGAPPRGAGEEPGGLPSSMRMERLGPNA